MEITDLRVNHIKNPVGYDMSYQTFSWKYDDITEQENGSFHRLACRVLIAEDEEFLHVIADSGFSKKITGVSYELQLQLKPCMRYYWKVEARISQVKVIKSENAFFETGKGETEWRAHWIGIKDDPLKEGVYKIPSPVIRKSFHVEKELKRAKVYVTGLGLYEVYINGVMMNDGYLQPGFNNYNLWMQYQTLDVTKKIHKGENVMAFLLGAGWYKGRFGVNGGFENNFGENYHLLCELHLEYEDGTIEIIGSNETFKFKEGPVRFSNIYDGEIFDATIETDEWMKPGFDDTGWSQVELLIPEVPGRLTERFSIPVVVKEKKKPLKIITAKSGKKVLDMGQNMAGWLTFTDSFKFGHEITLKFAEQFENGEICIKNLHGARAEFNYISDGKPRLVRPHFTYFGFRYVQLEGFSDDVCIHDFEAWSMYSDMENSGTVATGHEEVNKFISNACWSQKDNFIEHPTDCPQRAERLGWTGDAQLYCKTANYNMYAPAFFRKYMKDVNAEQIKAGGFAPFIVPKINGRGFEASKDDECSAAWSDVSTIIPWFLYVYYGDKNLLREEYMGMKTWVNYMMKQAAYSENPNLWQSGFHFGDWLALDNPEPGPFGKTDKYYISSCFYYYSTHLLAEAAKVLGKTEDAKQYIEKAEQIRKAIIKEYFDENEICTQDTQTGYVLAIYMDIVSQFAQRKNGRKLADKIKENKGHLDSGFVGTAYICLALSKAGFDKEAYDLLLVEDCPGWLYQVQCGATTVWEAWDALNEDGTLNGDMSLNHYAYGAIVEWIYSDVCGIKPMQEYPGFAKVLIEPKPDSRIGDAEAVFDSASGKYKVSWKYESDTKVIVQIQIPFAGSALLKLKDAGIEKELAQGDYEFTYEIVEKK